MVKQDIVWCRTADDVLQRVQATLDVCEGFTKIAITTNPRGADHWKAIKAQELFASEVIPRIES